MNRILKTTLGLSLLGFVMLIGLPSNSNAQEIRFRVRHNGYRTDNRGAELLRNAVREGYREGYMAGQADRSNRRRTNWRRNEVYRDGTRGYDSYVARNQYQYYFQQGFQRGYDDGYRNGRRYGNNNTILGNVVESILGIRRY